MNRAQISYQASFNKGSFQFLHTDEYDYGLGCELCFKINHSTRKHHFIAHTNTLCAGSIIAVKKKAESKWEMSIRSRPIHPNIRNYKLCPNSPNEGASCYSAHCTYPHNSIEKQYWNLELNGEINIEICRQFLHFERFGGEFKFICKQCYKRGKFEALDDKGFCLIHKWLPKNKLLAHGNDAGIQAIVPRPTQFKGQARLCKHMAKCRDRLHGVCTYAHSEIELKIWNSEEEYDTDLLVKWSKGQYSKSSNNALIPVEEAMNTGGPSTQSKKVIGTVLTPDIVKRRSCYCEFCGIQYLNTHELQNHTQSDDHLSIVKIDQGHQWNFRQPPWGQDIKRHEDGEQCLSTDIPDIFNYCPYAHSRLELEEWKNRKRWRQINRLILNGENGYALNLNLLTKISNGQLKVHDEYPDISIECNDELHQVSNKDTFATSWKFEIKTSKKTNLQNVLLLNHHDRLHFSIRTESDDYRQCQTVPGNIVKEMKKQKKQKKFNEYTIDIRFLKSNKGFYTQSVIMEFNDELILKRDISVEICDGPASSVNEIYGEPPTMVSDEATNRLLSLYPQPTRKDCLKAKYGRQFSLNSYNYKHKMHQLINSEEFSRQMIISRYNKKIKISILNILEGESFLYAQNGELFGRMYVEEDICEDTDAGRLFLDGVQSALLRPVNLLDNGKFYRAAIIRFDKFSGKHKNYIFFRFTSDIVSELDLKAETMVDVDVRFEMDRGVFLRMHHAVDCLQNMDVVYPALNKLNFLNWNEKDITISSDRLSEDQMKAVRHIVSKKEYSPPLVVYGPYGTGKTETLAEATKALLLNDRKCRILICTYTNSAADIYLQKYLDGFLKDKNMMQTTLRIYQSNRRYNTVPEVCIPYSLVSEDHNSFKIPTYEDIIKKNLIITTVETAYELVELKLYGKFSHVFIDEAAQSLECQLLMPLSLADEHTCVVLTGDHRQMSHKLYSVDASEQGFGTSLLVRLFHFYNETFQNQPKNVSMINLSLNRNYRSEIGLLQFISECFYGGPDFLKWRSRDLGNDIFQSMNFYSVFGSEVQDTNSTSFYNGEEAVVIAEGVYYMAKNWPEEWGPFQPEKIQVIASYSQQVNLIRSELRKLGLKHVNVDRIYNIQGKEFRALFISTVRTGKLHMQLLQDQEAEIGEFGFFSNMNMLNTAFTRAQSYVAVVGDPVALCSFGDCSEIWKKYIKRCNDLKTCYPVSYENIKVMVSQIENSLGRKNPVNKFNQKTEITELITPQTNTSRNIWHSGRTLSEIIQSQQNKLPPGVIRRTEDKTTKQRNNRRIKQQIVPGTFKYGKVIEDKSKAEIYNEDYDDWDDFKMKPDEIIQKLGEMSSEINLEEVNDRNESNTMEPIKISYQVKEERGHAVLYPMTASKVKRQRKLLTEKDALSDNDEMETSDEEGEDHLGRASGGQNLSDTKSSLEKLVMEDPDKYKICMIEISNGIKIARLIRQDSERTEIEISQSSARTALEHDLVVVEILTDIGIKSEDDVILRGNVIGILERAVKLRYKKFVCRVDPINTSVMIPVKKNMIPIFNLNLKDSDKCHKDGKVSIYELKRDGSIRFLRYENIDPTNPNGKLFLVRLLKFKKALKLPLGIVFGIHDVGDKLNSGLSIIDNNYHINRKLVIELHEADYNLNKSDLNGREDFRGKLCFTIDPTKSTDLDDAISIEILDDNKCVVGVHIADVSHYITKDSELDVLASKKCTTYYSIDREPIYMLPKSVTSKLSLLPNVDRLTISVMLYLNGDFNVEDVKVHKSIIKSKRRLTYEETQEILEGKQDDLTIQIQLLNIISDIWRRQRLGRSWNYKNVDFIDRLHAQAHLLIAELMIMTNHHVALILRKTFPQAFPIRTQRQPDNNRLDEWKDAHVAEAMNSVSLLNPFCQNREACSLKSQCACLIDYAAQGGIETASNFQVSLETIEMLSEAADSGNWQLFQYLFLSPDSYPQLSAALIQLRMVQGRAYYVCSRNSSSQFNIHYDLNLTPYTHFTSPIRRYFDIIVHRMLVASMTASGSPYTEDELDKIAWKCNVAFKTSQNYESDVFKLHSCLALKEKPLVYFAPIQSVTNGQICVTFPRIKQFKSQEGKIKMGCLAPSSMPTVNEDEKSVLITWHERIYNLEECRMQGDWCVRLQQPKETITVECREWQQLLNAVCQNNITTALDGFSTLKNSIGRGTNQGWLSQLQSEAAIKNKLTHFVHFSANYKVGLQLKIQMAPEMHKGIFQPKIQLLYLSSNLSMCLEHRRDPISCFTETASRRASKSEYKSIKEYKNLWLPVIAMESVSGAVKGHEHLFLHNVPIEWEVIDEEHTSIEGVFKLPKTFCEDRGLDFWSDYVCVRYKNLKIDLNENVSTEVKAQIDHNEKVTFVCHCKVSKVTQRKKADIGGEITISIKLQQCSMNFPDQLLQNIYKYTLEIIPKSLPQRRIERTLEDLQYQNDSLAVKVALGTEMPCKVLFSDIDKLMETPFHQTLNDLQRKFIKEALEKPFTLIQGPPGTGKTVTGVHLAALFCIRNRNISKKTLLLYCGPSNKSVDVVAEKLLNLQEHCPKFIRVYGDRIEKTEFPLPRQIVPKKKRRLNEVSKNEEVKKRALHHMIRLGSNPCSKEIKQFDELFKKMKADDTEADIGEDTIKEYKSVILDAKRIELQKAELILTTCNASSSAVLTECDNIHIAQVIIDEAAMCTEPETMIPIVAHKTRQIVLIGDHKQLHPIIVEEKAKNLGLQTSLFERYSAKSSMLREQYRMHKGIMAFPSLNFYDNQLKCGTKKQRRPVQLDIWPNGRYYPTVLCHVEGEEESLTVSTEDGSEMSKSNEIEAQHVVTAVIKLVQEHKIKTEKIVVLSQYRAQCALIKRIFKEKKLENIAVLTVIASQGSEWDFVIFSTVRSMPEKLVEMYPSKSWIKHNLGFIADEHQVNVALTRAKWGHVIIGNKYLLNSDPVWKKLIAYYEDLNMIVDAQTFHLTKPLQHS